MFRVLIAVAAAVFAVACSAPARACDHVVDVTGFAVPVAVQPVVLQQVSSFYAVSAVPLAFDFVGTSAVSVKSRSCHRCRAPVAVASAGVRVLSAPVRVLVDRGRSTEVVRERRVERRSVR